MCIITVIIMLVFVAQAHAKGLTANSSSISQDSFDKLAGKLADKLVDKIFDHALRSLRLRDADLNNVILTKPGRLAIPSLRVREPTFPHPRPAVSPNRAQQFRGQRIPVMSMNSNGRSMFPSEPDSLSRSADELNVLSRKSVPEPWKKKIDELTRQVFISAIALAIALSPNAALADDSRFSKVDKDGPIGAIATVIENGIDQAHDKLEGAGFTSNTYGLSIVLFTILIRSFTVPLVKLQIESQTKVQQLQPYQDRIKKAFPGKDEEVDRNRAVGRLFQMTEVNPVAGLLPSFAQIPILISLYRSLTNLVAGGKLKEGFLWLPSLEGPVWNSADQIQTSDWFNSIFSGNPVLGWDTTKAYLTIPLILLISQSVSIKLLTPPQNSTSTEPETAQERLGKNLIFVLPFFVASFSINVPSGLGIYWITSNLLTTLITLTVRATVKKNDVPPEVEKMMEEIETLAAQSVLRAAKSSDLKQIRNLLAEGGDANEADGEGRSALHFAAGKGSVPVVKSLIAFGADMDARDMQGNTPIFYATGYGFVGPVLTLLDAGANVTVNTAGQSPADVALLNTGNAIVNDTALMARLSVEGSESQRALMASLTEEGSKESESQTAKTEEMKPAMANAQEQQQMQSMGAVNNTLDGARVEMTGAQRGP